MDELCIFLLLVLKFFFGKSLVSEMSLLIQSTVKYSTLVAYKILEQFCY